MDDARDFRSNIIRIGYNVKYLGTHTTGKVLDFHFKDGFWWVQLDSTKLYYRSDFLICIENIISKNHSRACLEDHLNKSRIYKKAAATEISDLTDGPGYGGG